MAEKPLSSKRKQFVAEYLIDLKAGPAYIRAGYSPQGADQSAARLLRNAQISRAVAEAMKARSEETGITAADALRELWKVAKANMADFISPHGTVVLPKDGEQYRRDLMAAVGEYTVDAIGSGEDMPVIMRTKIKLSPKLQALDQVFRHLGLYREGANLPKTQDLGTLAPADVARELLFGLRVLLDEQARNPAPPASPAKPASVH